MSEFEPAGQTDREPSSAAVTASLSTQTSAVATDLPSAVGQLFDPPGHQWNRVSDRLATARRQVSAITLGVIAVPVALVVALTPAPLWTAALPLVVGVALYVWLHWLIGRQVRAYGYAERDEDLLVVHGIMFRRLVVVPYGRMQMVDVESGPLERKLGIAHLQLHTASASSDVSIPGLPPLEAAALRDRLAEAGELRTAGL